MPGNRFGFVEWLALVAIAIGVLGFVVTCERLTGGVP